MRAQRLLMVAALVLAGFGSSAVAAQNKAEAAANLPAETAPPAGLALTGRVTDAANILKPEEIEALTSDLADFEARTKHQMVVVTVASLDGQPIEQYTLALVNRWGVGRKGINDGVVLLVAPNERRVRIEVGYGLEKALTNDYCTEIIDRMLPFFRDSRFSDGIREGVKGLVEKVS